MRAIFLIFMALSLGACVKEAASGLPSLRGEPTGLGAESVLTFRANQISTAEALADVCAHYKINRAYKEALREEAKQDFANSRPSGLIDNLPFNNGIVASRDDSFHYIEQYDREMGLAADRSPANYCRVADQEMREGTVIGKLLLPVD